MNLKLERNTLIALKATAVISTIIVILRQIVENTDSIYNALLFFSASILGLVFVFFNSLILTNSKGLVNFGAAVSLIIGLVIVGKTINILFHGDNLSGFYTDEWTTYQYLAQVLVACVAGLYLVFEVERRLSVIERLGLVVIIPTFMFVQTLSSQKGEEIFDVYRLKGVTSVVIVTVVGLAVLYFSNLQHTIAAPLIFSMMFIVLNTRTVKEFSSDNDITAISIAQLCVAVVFAAYCGFIVWRMSVMGQKAGRVPSLEQLLAEKNDKGPGPAVGLGSVVGPGPIVGPGPEQGPPPANPLW